MNSSQIVQRLDQIEALTRELRELLASGDDVVLVHGQGAWRADMLARLWPRVAHLQGVTTLFEMCAERAPDDVTFPQLLARSGLTHRQQANEHARLSRVARELFNHKSWPMENWQDSREGTMHYRMDRAVARWWSQIVEETGRRPSTAQPVKAVPVDMVNDLAGKWVAEDGDEIVAVGDSPHDLVAELRRSGRRAAVRRIPSSAAEADVDLVA